MPHSIKKDATKGITIIPYLSLLEMIETKPSMDMGEARRGNRHHFAKVQWFERDIRVAYNSD